MIRMDKMWDLRPVAHRLISEAKAEGWLVSTPCEQCGEVRTVAHHDDYARPMWVRWLCHPCHRTWHTLNGKGAHWLVNPQHFA